MPLFCPVTETEIIVCREAAALARKAAEQFVARAGESIARSGRFTVALSGGTTPATLYALLASAEFRDRIEWQRVHVFWGDERCVPPDQPDSNFRMTRQNLLKCISLPPENVHRMLGENEPEEAAAAYEAELKKFFCVALGALPRFDLIFLGLGEDGHTASIFPGSNAVDEFQALVTVVYVERLQSHRLTLTLPVINAAAQVTFLVSGASKAKVVAEILAANGAAGNYPGARVRPTDGRLTWLITADAAKGLPWDMVEKVAVGE
jgi:6-phosphogluconolactonase